MSAQYYGSMPKELKQKWLEALRSGEWIQAKGTLHDPDTGGFCCLGVLQYVASRGRCETGLSYDGRSSYREVFRGLPSVEWLDKEHIEIQEAVAHLAGMNDTFQKERGSFIPDSGNFAEIADWIEEHIEGV